MNLNMTKEEIYEYAVKGLQHEISELDKTVREGYCYLTMLDNGEKPPTKLSAEEISKICREGRDKIEELNEKRFMLDWKLAGNDD